MIVQQTASTNTYTPYAQRILTAITDMQKKVNDLYLKKDSTNARSLIFNDYTVNIDDAANPALNVSFTYNTQAAQRSNSPNYTHIFIRCVLAANQDLWTLSPDSFKSLQGLLGAPVGGNGYFHFQQSNPAGSMFSNVDFIAEQQVEFTHPASVTVDTLATAIQNLVTNSLPVQTSLNQILSAPHVPMPPFSTSTVKITGGQMPVDNFAALGTVAFARIGEWKMIQTSYPADYPVSYEIGVYNEDVGSSPACTILYNGTQASMRANWLCTDDFSNDWFTLAWIISAYSPYQNSSSEIQPGSNGQYVFFYDTGLTNITKTYGQAAYNPITPTSGADLGAAAKAFYLSTRV